MDVSGSSCDIALPGRPGDEVDVFGSMDVFDLFVRGRPGLDELRREGEACSSISGIDGLQPLGAFDMPRPMLWSRKRGSVTIPVFHAVVPCSFFGEELLQLFRLRFLVSRLTMISAPSEAIRAG